MLFVSHNMTAIQAFCSRCYLLNRGELIADEPERRRSRLDPAAEKSCHGRRFAGDSRIAPVLTDGTHISGIPAGSLDPVVTFDAFMHLEPWEICGYPEIGQTLLRAGGIGIVHFLDVETPIGFRLFQLQLPGVVERGVGFVTFSVMSEHHATIGKGRRAPTGRQ